MLRLASGALSFDPLFSFQIRFHSETNSITRAVDCTRKNEQLLKNSEIVEVVTHNRVVSLSCSNPLETNDLE